MKRLVALAALVCIGLMVLSSVAAAQDERPRGTRTRTFQPGGRMQQTPDARKELIEKSLGQLELKDEQKEKIEKVKTESAEKFKAYKEKSDKLNEKMAAAREEGDREKMAGMREERQALMTEGQQLIKDYEEAIKKELTEEQTKKLDEMLLPPIPAATLVSAAKSNAEALKLSEEQKKEVDKLAEEYGQAGGGTAFQEMREKIQKLRDDGASQDDIRKAQTEMMTKAREESQKRDAECKTKLEKLLSADQMKQLNELARKQMQERPSRRPGQDATGTERPRRERREQPAAEDSSKSSTTPKDELD